MSYATSIATAQTLPSGVIDAPPTVIGNNQSIGSDTMLNVWDGGTVGRNFVAGAADESSVNVELNIAGGSVGVDAFLSNDSAFNANAGAVVNISGGRVGSGANANSGSEINISGGSIGFGIVNAILPTFNANSGSAVNIAGGAIRANFNARAGSQVNISGGAFGLDENRPVFYAHDGSTVNISGGQFGRGFAGGPSGNLTITGGNFGDFFAAAAADISGGSFGSDFKGGPVNLIGGEFLVNEAVPSGDLVTLDDLDILTGTLADGSTFIFSPLVNDTLVNVRLVDGNLPAFVPSITVTDGDSPKGLRPGQTITVENGGSLPRDFAAVGGTLNINGGSVDVGLEIVDTEVTMSGGSIGYDAGVFAGSVVNVSGGSIGPAFQAYTGSEVNVSGGNLASFSAHAGSTTMFSGGSAAAVFARSGSAVNISGGEIDRLDARAGSELNLFGTSFALDGAPLDGLSTGEPFTISVRDKSLSGMLSDGSSFNFDLGSTTASHGPDHVSPDAILTITLTQHGDFDADGAVDGSDFLQWQQGDLASPLSADSLSHWKANFGVIAQSLKSSAAVPEPSTAISLLTGLAVCAYCALGAAGLRKSDSWRPERGRLAGARGRISRSGMTTFHPIGPPSRCPADRPRRRPGSRSMPG